MERNHNVKVGDVFYDASYDPDWGRSVRFVQITALRGKCTAEYRFIRKECWIKEAEIKDVGAYFAVEDLKEIEGWSPDFSSVTSRGYMTGYRDLGKKIRPLYRFLSRFGDHFIKMRIVKIAFKGE